jgi:hypothetical protein
MKDRQWVPVTERRDEVRAASVMALRPSLHAVDVSQEAQLLAQPFEPTAKTNQARRLLAQPFVWEFPPRLEDTVRLCDHAV